MTVTPRITTTQLFVTSTNYHRVFVRRRALAANTTTRSALTALQTMKVPHLGAAMDPALASFANTSQVGQARILAKLFGALGPGSRTFAELGFNTDEQCVGSGSNTCGLWRA
eukprot:scaffold72095_cov102-Phaeocystis_antarctica.AAC.1